MSWTIHFLWIGSRRIAEVIMTEINTLCNYKGKQCRGCSALQVRIMHCKTSLKKKWVTKVMLFYWWIFQTKQSLRKQSFITSENCFLFFCSVQIKLTFQTIKKGKVISKLNVLGEKVISCHKGSWTEYVNLLWRRLSSLTSVSILFSFLCSWLLRDDKMKLRTTYTGFTEAVNVYFNKLIPKLVPLQVGP